MRLFPYSRIAHGDCRDRRGSAAAVISCLPVCAVLLVCSATVHAQQLLDRVVARVNGAVITLSDVRVAAVDVIAGTQATEMDRVIRAVVDRQLLLAEVERFPPPEPAPAAVNVELAAMRARMGAALPTLMQETGTDDQRLRELARENLRVRAYLDQRFGDRVQVSDADVAQYYRTHLEEFTNNGATLAFDQAEPMARERASAARRQASIDLWLSDLRARADVVVLETAP